MIAGLSSARRAVRDARNLVVLSGAGLSAESGVPTFRGDGGLWEQRRPEELATPEAFSRDPALVWRFYLWRRKIIASCVPNKGHQSLFEMEGLPGKEFLHVTQNVDGLHRRTGAKKVIELHGCLWFVRCTSCGARYEDRNLDIPIPPTCRECNGLLRPDVVWFGEALPERAVKRSFDAASSCDLMIVVGTSGLVQPAASIAVSAKEAGAVLIDVNPEPGPISSIADYYLKGKAGEMLPALLP